MIMIIIKWEKNTLMHIPFHSKQSVHCGFMLEGNLTDILYVYCWVFCGSFCFFALLIDLWSFFFPFLSWGKRSEKMERLRKWFRGSKGRKREQCLSIYKGWGRAKKKLNRWKCKMVVVLVYIFTCLFLNQKTLICCVKIRGEGWCWGFTNQWGASIK